MLEKKTKGFLLPEKTRGARGRNALMGMLTAAVLGAASAGAVAQNAQTTQPPAQTTQPTQTTPDTQPPTPKKTRFGQSAPVTYDNKWEIYGGINYMNFQAGQDLPKLMNLGGGEVLGTYWITPKWGLGAEWRGEWGTTPVKPNIVFNGRALASLNGALAGAQYRGPKNQYAALNFHGYFGAMYGKFDYTTDDPTTLGMYTNRMKPMAALGGSVDINKSKNWAIRLSPDLILEHFGTETREFFAISGGVVYRIGKR
ncbi:hypothetical protein [Edaphobacter aggregans]|uniref:hypothetical protein n=1 Tax=Edaphobacter aggregans TaxID=570835 RepID=UPI0005559E69|nr:hypothetical protein [Edaphobacter aggregans]